MKKRPIARVNQYSLLSTKELELVEKELDYWVIAYRQALSLFPEDGATALKLFQYVEQWEAVSREIRGRKELNAAIRSSNNRNEGRSKRPNRNS